MPSVLKVHDLSVCYRQDLVLDHISLSVEQGSCFGLIGLNAAGKTTLIKSILGLHPFDAGQIYVLDSTPGCSSVKGRIAYLPERFSPPWFLTGLEFIKFSLDIYQKPFEEQALLDNATELSLSKEALDRKVQTYSKGMRQKLGILSCVLVDAEVLILDEPMSGLDPLSRGMVKDMVRRAQKKGRTIFLSSHILTDIEELCDTVGVLHDKKIRFYGTPLELKSQYEEDNFERAFLKVL